jgi:hypothetical protein
VELLRVATVHRPPALMNLLADDSDRESEQDDPPAGPGSCQRCAWSPTSSSRPCKDLQSSRTWVGAADPELVYQSKQANEYLDLVGAALYVLLLSRRPGGKGSSVCELEISTSDRP